MSTDKKFRNAYLVLAHEDVEMLNFLAKRLINSGYVYIHLDQKSKIRVNQVINHPYVKVYKKIKVNWGSFSIVEATQLLANSALDDGATRLTLICGLSYPIVNDLELIEFGKSQSDFFDSRLVNLKLENKTFKRRFTSKHNTFVFKQNVFGRIIRRLSREFWALMPRMNPEKDLNGLQLCFGSQWWSVTSQTYVDALSVASRNPDLSKYFSRIECSDESFFVTLFNFVSHNPVLGEITLVNWVGRGLVRQFEFRDVPFLARAEKKFARKCSVSVARIIEKSLLV
jgi:hypothetical protein